MSEESFTLSRQDLGSLLRMEPANFIDGTWRPSSSGRVVDVVDPSTEGSLAAIPIADTADINAAVDAALRARSGWRRTTPGARAGILMQWAAVCAEHLDEFALLESVDVGKPISAAREEVAGVIDAMQFFAEAGRTLMAPTGGEYLDATTSIMQREPVGTVLGITPWNYPLLQTVAKVFPALAVGNTFVLKPSEMTPLTAIRLAELSEGILPPGVLNIVFGTGPETGNELVHHAGFNMVSFTGSVGAGRIIGSNAARGLKRSIMELGGNAPVVVFEDANMDRLESIVFGGLYNAGQECMAASRVIAHESVVDQVVEGLSRLCQTTVVGDSLDPETVLGPLNSAVHFERVMAKLDARPAGAEIVSGGNRRGNSGYFLEPTVIVGVDQDSDLVKEEIFGPVFTVQSFRDEAEALDLANGTEYGLAASVFTSSVGRAMRMSSAMDFGTIWINNHLIFAADLPVSGFGISGYGTENASVGVQEFTRLKHVMVDQRD